MSNDNDTENQKSDRNKDLNEKTGQIGEVEGVAVTAEARRAALAEHQLSVIEAFKTHPKAMLWAAFFNISIVLVGYDPQIISSFYAQTAFQQQFGKPVGDGEYIVEAKWQTALSMNNPIGQTLGSLCASPLMERYGRKKTLAGALIFNAAFIFMQFFAANKTVLVIGEMFLGLTFGVFCTIAPSYASEVCPLSVRGILTAFVNLSFVIGQFVAQGIATGFSDRQSSWAYRIPFAFQWLWPVILLAGLPFAPESPYWLVRKGRFEDAKKSLSSLISGDKISIEDSLAMIEETDRLEAQLASGSSFIDCFKGSDLRRTEISVGVYLIQVLCGNPMIGYATYFFTLAGLEEKNSFYMGLGTTALGFVGTVLSWFLLSAAGRRSIYANCMIVLTGVLFIIAFLDLPPDYSSKPGLQWAQASLLIIWTFVYQLSVGPICFVIISEISSTKLRSRTIAISTAVQAVANIVMTVAVPYLLNSDEANLRGKTCFFFGGLSILCTIWSWLRIPESKNRTYEELDIMFERKVKTREFKNYVVEHLQE